MTDVLTGIETAIDNEVQVFETDIKRFWTTEEPILVNDLKTAAQQLATIVVQAMTTVLQGVTAGSVTSEEAFGKLVTSAYQTAVSTGLQVGITDVQQAASQAVASAKTLVATPAAVVQEPAAEVEQPTA